MAGLIFVAACLLYLGRILAWTWGSKPLELGDIVFLVPILMVVFVLRRRRIRGESRSSAVGAEVDASDEAIRPAQEGRRQMRGDGEEILRLQQEWAAAEYNWWKR
jgi:hypothetical protein